jgi:DNA-binding LacI/PurR family transcriptional regulator
MREVARQAGVSLATVSRVLSGSAPVRPHTRERVERALRETLYVAPGNRIRTGVIGLLVPDLENPIFPELAQALETIAAEAGFSTILCNTTPSALEEDAYVHMLIERGVDGMVFISSQLTNPAADHAHYFRALQEGARVVLVNCGHEELAAPSVGVDERAAGDLAATHLLGLGHRRIGFVAGLEHYMPTREKTAGLRDALGRHGIELDPSLITHAEWGFAGGAEGARRLLALGPERPSALLASSDVMAIGALFAAHEAGVRVPDDLSIVGFDGVAVGAYTVPPLTTVAQPTKEIAATTVEALTRLIERPEREVPHSVFRPRLVERGSTAPPSNHRSF